MEARGIEVAEVVSASKKLGAADAEALAEAAMVIHVARGRSTETFSGGSPTPEIVERMLGPTGNLRAPTIKVGDVLLVGFDEDVYALVLGRRP